MRRGSGGGAGLDISNRSARPRLRSAVVDDLSAIYDLEVQELGPHAYPYFVLRQLFDIHGSRWIVADHGGVLCGYALLAVGPEREAWLMGMAVSAHHQGRGLGRSLLERALTECRIGGVVTVSITVHPSNTHAISLYKGSGFTWVGYYPEYFGAGEPRQLRVKQITADTRWPVDPNDRRWSKGENLPPGE